MAEPEAKRQKTEETKEEAPPELEKDAKPSSSKPLRPDVTFETSECTLNVIPSLGGRVLMPLTDGGMQYLIGGARANLGIKKGRYLFEVKVVEAHNPSEGAQRSFRSTVSRNLVRVGFSTQGTSLLLGEGGDSVYFDNDGFYVADQKRESTSQRFSRDNVVAILLNLDAASPNANTVSLFRDGVRVAQPQKLPEKLLGKPLFPHVSFKNITLHVNFGPPSVPLPFTCLSVAEVPTADGVEAPAPTKDGKYEVIFPVAVPDEGTFDWLDDFLDKNPKYVELSDRAIIKWAEKSGISHTEQSTWKHCNDKPDPQFRVPLLDDFSARRVIQAVAPTQPRHYIVMEVKSNLVKEERSQLLKRFSENYFKTVAEVVMGEPPADFKEKVHKALLTEKQEKATQDWKRRKMEKEQERLQRKRQRELEEAKKRAEEEAKRKLEELERQAAEAAAEAERAAQAAEKAEEEKKEGEKTEGEKGEGESQAETKGNDVQEAKTEVKEEKEVKDEPKTEVKDEPMPEVKQEVKEEEPEELDEPCPQVVLTEEDKAAWFRKKATPDLTSWTLGSCFAKFSIPDKDEGFSEIRYGWSAKNEKANEYLANYIRKSKISNRIEDLMPGDWFKSKLAEWQKTLEDLKNKQKEFQLRPPQPPQENVPVMPEAQAAQVEGGEAPQDGQTQAGQEGQTQEGQTEGEAPKEPNSEEPLKADIKPPSPAEVDVMAVDDVCNVNGSPLFAQFAFEDWVLLNLRAELHLMANAFAKDAADPERVGIHDQHLAFYYQKYFKKQLVPKHFSTETTAELVEKLLKDTLSYDSDLVLVAKHGEELSDFGLLVKLTEAARRERQAKIDSGDETVKLRFEQQTMPPPPPQQAAAPTTLAVKFRCAKSGDEISLSGSQRGRLALTRQRSKSNACDEQQLHALQLAKSAAQEGLWHLSFPPLSEGASLTEPQLLEELRVLASRAGCVHNIPRKPSDEMELTRTASTSSDAERAESSFASHGSGTKGGFFEPLSSDVCAICLGSLGEQTWIRGAPLQTRCGHFFHRMCLRRHLRSSIGADSPDSGACPNCRTANAALGTSNCRAKPLSWQVAQDVGSRPLDLETQYRFLAVLCQDPEAVVHSSVFLIQAVLKLQDLPDASVI